VTRSFDVKYGGSGNAWAAGEACRSLHQVCENASSIGHAGNLGVVGIILVALGQACLLSYQFMRKKRDMSKLLWVSSGAFALAWVMLLASWAVFAGALYRETTCVIVDVATRSAVTATGTFADIINGGSYSYGYVIFSWILLTAVLAVVVQRVFHDMRHPFAKDVAEGADEKPSAVHTEEVRV
jgi:hypothetical protein